MLNVIHAFVWPAMVLLFILALMFNKQALWRMLLRLSYVLMLISGFILLALIHFPLMLVIKGVLGLVLIGLMEVALARRGRNESFTLFFILAVLVGLVVVLIGYRVI
ncbi:MAG: DUF1516 family protein [Sporolactobacillus sp.]